MSRVRWFFRAVLVLMIIPWLTISLGWISEASDLSIAAGLSSLLAGGLFVFPELFRLVNKIGAKRVLLVFAALIIGGGCARVSPGYAGIKVNQWGTDKGVQSAPLVTGTIVYNPFSSDVLEYPTFVQTAVWTKDPAEGHPSNEEITFTTMDQMAVSADISLAYHLEYEKVPAFYVKFRSDDLDKFTHGFLRNLAREKFDTAAGKYRIESIMGDNAEFLKEVRTALQNDLNPIGVMLDQFGFIGAPRPPQAVIDAISSKVKATQDAIRVENELRQTEAEAKKRVALADGEAKARITEAEGRSRANEILQKGITSQLVEWRRLDIQQQALEKWNGHLPVTMLGNQSVPFIHLQPEK